MVLVVGMAAAAAAAAAGLSVGKPCHLAPLYLSVATRSLVWRSLTPPSKIGKGSGYARLREALCMRMRINSRERGPAN